MGVVHSIDDGTVLLLYLIERFMGQYAPDDWGGRISEIVPIPQRNQLGQAIFGRRLFRAICLLA